MLSINPTEAWRETHPGAVIGILEVSGGDNSGISAELNNRKRMVVANLREKYGCFTRRDFGALPVMAAYDRYYNRFDKTYHVLLQVESIALKGKNLPEVSPLVDANFAAEVETFILTAGHDADKLSGDVVMDVSREGDQITQMNGTLKDLRAEDMIMRDERGICCSILYGQDNRSLITPQTTHALYVSYCPAGIGKEDVEKQLGKIEEYIRLFSPNVKVEQCRLIQA